MDQAVLFDPDQAVTRGDPLPARMLATARTAPEPPALELAGVAHRFGRAWALQEVSVHLEAGETVCLLGPSGCGKSTLLRIAAGIERLQAGMVRIGGRCVASPDAAIAPEDRGVGFVFQDYALFPHLSVLDNVRFGLRRLARTARRTRALDALAQVGMADLAAAYPHQLSGGQQQRVALARALAPRPAVLLLDEPFSSLDVCLRQQVRDDTLQVLKRHRVAALMVTHDPEEAMYCADRIVLMRQGRVVQSGTPAELYFRPIDAFAAGFLGETNRFVGRVRLGAVETPLGRVPVPGTVPGTATPNRPGDDAEVEVLVRPDGILVHPPGRSGAVPGTVTAARLLGRSCLAQIEVVAATGEPISVAARVPGPVPPRLHPVSLSLDPGQVFVFSRPTD